MEKIDPTRIDQRFDPKTMKLSGTTYHKNIDFEVPYMTQIDGNLWMGGCQNGLILPAEIKHLVSLYITEAYQVHKDIRSYMIMRAYDGPIKEIESVIDGLADWIIACSKDAPILVHCQAGLNRSGVVMAYVLMKLGRTAREAIDFLRKKRSPAVLCNQVFEDWLLARSLD